MNFVVEGVVHWPWDGLHGFGLMVPLGRHAHMRVCFLITFGMNFTSDAGLLRLMLRSYLYSYFFLFGYCDGFCLALTTILSRHPLDLVLHHEVSKMDPVFFFPVHFVVVRSYQVLAFHFDRADLIDQFRHIGLMQVDFIVVFKTPQNMLQVFCLAGDVLRRDVDRFEVVEL